MNKLILFLLFSLPFICKAQSFTKINTGSIALDKGDSRSVNIIDVNNDGWEDIFISNGLKGGQNDLLYINNGDGSFTKETEMDIVQDGASSVGASFADVNNDGYIDAYVTNWYGQANHFYINDGNGQLNRSNNSIIELGSFSETATWGDFNKDGNLDLFVTNSGGDKKNYLFQNLGNFNFKRVEEGPLTARPFLSRSANWIDYNQDGQLDLYVTNESNTSNDLFTNNANGNFSFSSLSNGKSSMSSSWGDIDNDGDLDLFVANAGFYKEQNNRLFRNDGGSFTEISKGDLANDGGCSYGSNFGDYDNDGDLDLIVANGFCNSNLKNFLYENQGDGTFIKTSKELPYLRLICSYGIAWGDVNNDGFLDLAIANCKNKSDGFEPSNDLFINNGNGNNWLKVKLEGVETNRFGVGTVVRIKSNETWQMRLISAQTGYCGQNSLLAHFGLGEATKVDSLVVFWPTGKRSYLFDLEANQSLVVNEGTATSTKNIAANSTLQLSCWPNPLKANSSHANIIIANNSTLIGNDITLSFHDVNGKVFWKKELTISAKQNRIQFNPSRLGLSSGVYFLKIKQIAPDSQEVLSKKIMVF